MRGLDKLAFLLIVAGAIFSWVTREPDAPDMRRPPPMAYKPAPAPDMAAAPEATPRPRRPLPPPSSHDPAYRVAPSRKGDSTGTAFAIADGAWLTARHVTRGCSRVALVTPKRKLVRIEQVTEHPRADVAVIRTSGGPAPLGIADRRLEIGEDGFMFGFPQGRPGDVQGSLIGRARSVTREDRLNVEPVLAWSEIRRAPDRGGSLGGLSGGPALDSEGRIVGVVSSESQRRGRVMTAAPVSIREVLGLAGVTPSPAAGPRPSPRTFPTIGEELRRTLTVAQVYCDVD
jgi:S1-C subfamily serine protease